jgi:hypothetical protein
MFDRTGYVLKQTVKQRVVVTLKTGEGFDGLLFWADGKTWELVQAKALGVGDRGADVPVDGTLLIPAENVAYAQRLP